MAIYENETHFAGKPVVDWNENSGLPDPENTIYRLRLSWDEADADQAWTDRFAAFLQQERASEVTGSVVGDWGHAAEGSGSGPVVEALTAASDRLPRLVTLFLGDITMEESEISWIQQSDVSPLFDAYPRLTHLRVRGANGLSLGTPRHSHLQTLIIESGGLPGSVLEEVIAADLPALEHLELWLGTQNYGAEATVESLAPIFDGSRWPNLAHLALRDSDIADDIAAALADAPVTQRLRVLDLSLGTLGDAGAEALAASPAVAHLEKLDIHHHYVSPPMVEKLQALGIAVDASGTQEPDEWNGEEHRYVAVGE